MIFATPDFGASGGIVCFLLFIWAFVLGFVIWGGATGFRQLDGGSPRAKKAGIVLLVASTLLPLSCCLGPSQFIRLIYGNYPLGSYPNNTIQKGMTADDVVATLGTPHERYKHGDGESWYYWIDSFGASYLGIDFGPDGRVVGTHAN